MALPWLAIAQEKPAKVIYQPGKWYVGLQLGAYNFNTRDNMGIGNSNGGLMVLVGRRLSRHFDAQVGLLLPTSARRSGGGTFQHIKITDTTTSQVFSAYGKPVFIPITLKYLPFGSQHRFQPYLAVGFSIVIGQVKKETMLYNSKQSGYDPNIPGGYRPIVYDYQTENSGIKLLFGAQVGFGMNVRLVDRLHLSFELMAGRNLSTGGNMPVSAASGGLGLIYDFPPK